MDRWDCEAIPETPSHLGLDRPGRVDHSLSGTHRLLRLVHQAQPSGQHETVQLTALAGSVGLAVALPEKKRQPLARESVIAQTRC